MNEEQGTLVSEWEMRRASGGAIVPASGATPRAGHDHHLSALYEGKEGLDMIRFGKENHPQVTTESAQPLYFLGTLNFVIRALG
jgi:hypothetical protein